MQKLDHGKLTERLRERWEIIPGAAATKINRILTDGPISDGGSA